MYGLVYPRATVVPRSGKTSLYACVTIPDALRPLLKNRRQIYKTLFTPDRREAYERLSGAEAEIWRYLDQAQVSGLTVVANPKVSENMQSSLFIGGYCYSSKAIDKPYDTCFFDFLTKF